MDDVLDEIVSSEDLKKFERIYHDQLYKSNVSTEAQFNYAWCLVRSKYPADIRKGILLLENLHMENATEARRDYLYYLAIGNARIKEYNKALQFVRQFLNSEPTNAQVQGLEAAIKKRMDKEAFKEMAVAGGAAVLVMGGLVALGMALSREYTTALQYVRLFLNVEPENPQVKALEATITKRLNKEGLKGMALAGGAVLAVGGILALGMALKKRDPRH